MRKTTLALWALLAGAALFSYRSADAIPFRPSPVDFGCFQKNLARFELFVLKDDAPWIQKFIVAGSLVKYYDASHVSSAAETAVRAKSKIYDKATATLDKSELGEIDDCKDEANPDGCLKVRYCFKEAFIKIKNVLVTNEPERFQTEIKWFDKEISGNC